MLLKRSIPRNGRPFSIVAAGPAIIGRAFHGLCGRNRGWLVRRCPDGDFRFPPPFFSSLDPNVSVSPAAKDARAMRHYDSPTP
jgi:hypothetical protein